MRQTHLIIDEVQRMASESFKLVLQQGRSFGLSIGLANQSESDLMTKSANRLLDTIRANTQLKLYLNVVTDPNTVKSLEKAAGLVHIKREWSSIRASSEYQRHSLLQLGPRSLHLLVDAGHGLCGLWRQLVRHANRILYFG